MDEPHGQMDLLSALKEALVLRFAVSHMSFFFFGILAQHMKTARG